MLTKVAYAALSTYRSRRLPGYQSAKQVINSAVNKVCRWINPSTKWTMSINQSSNPAFSEGIYQPTDQSINPSSNQTNQLNQSANPQIKRANDGIAATAALLCWYHIYTPPRLMNDEQWTKPAIITSYAYLSGGPSYFVFFTAVSASLAFYFSPGGMFWCFFRLAQSRQMLICLLR